MISGQCLCTAVSWRARGPFTPLNHCHCSMCRKAHGAAFATFTSCAVEDFEWTSTRDTIRSYESSQDFVRPFCGTCGSTVPQLKPGGGLMRLPVGCTDMPSGLGGGRHIFAADKAPWHDFGGPEERHDAYPPDMAAQATVATQPRAENAPRTGTLRGSCLCGAVRFWLTEPFRVVHNCHCSLCRRARAAAHTTNGFVGLDALHFTEGEENITVFTLPDRGFGQTFCARCGSGVPRGNAERGIASVPFAALDDDPGRRPDDHIFVGSMADWYRITDDLPQFDKMPV